MPSPTAASVQRAIHARRTRMRRGAPESATAEETESSGDSECKSEESKVTAGLVSTRLKSVVLPDNRFAVLRPKEPAPGTKEEREHTLPLEPTFRRERPIIVPLQADILATDQPSSGERIKDVCLAPISPAFPCSKRPSIPRLAPHTPAKSTRIEQNQQLSNPAAASISPTKPQAQPSPLVLQAGAQSIRCSKRPSASARSSPDFDTAAPYLSLLAPQSAPILPPQKPLPRSGLAILPIHPFLAFGSLISPKSSAPESSQLAPPIPTSVDIFRSDDAMRHIVRTASGRILSIAAEIAAANEKSAARPVGNVLVPGPARKFREVKGKIDREKCHESKEYVNSPNQMEDGSDGEDGEGEGWLGKDQGFWKQPLEQGNVVTTRTQKRKEGSP